MESTLFKFSANINRDIYIKDPENSHIGTFIIKYGVELIDELGFENFTFRKLGLKTGVTEATIYRYFENKHKLLLYLTSWYWGWVEYEMVIKNSNLESPELKLRNAIQIIASPSHQDNNMLDLKKLFNIICSESSKAYLVKSVDDLNKYGVYHNYKKIVAIVSNILLQINPRYPYPHMLISTIIEGIHHQIFFADHLPSLTDTASQDGYLTDFYFDLALTHTLKSKK
jgi:AcrR family transcriptional regulator